LTPPQIHQYASHPPKAPFEIPIRRLFSFISQNWRGKPLITHEVIVKLIASTTTSTGLRVRSRLDTKSYPVGVTVSRQAMDALALRPESFHGDWNYTILPISHAKKH